jgi:hypothetical protein
MKQRFHNKICKKVGSRNEVTELSAISNKIRVNKTDFYKKQTKE